MKQYTTEQINKAVNGTLDGSPTIMITSVEQISEATANQLTFIGEKKYIKLWEQSRASAAIINNSLDVEPRPGRALIRVADADLALADVLRLFEPAPPQCGPGIHSTAVVDTTAVIGGGIVIGAGCYIGPGVVIGANTKLYPNVTVLDDTHIGSGTIIWSSTVIRERCQIGNHCIIHANVTIGADGFGYLPSPDGQGMVKIPQIGTVKIGGNAGVISDVAPGKTLIGFPAADYRQTLRLWAAQKQLPDLIRQMKKK